MNNQGEVNIQGILIGILVVGLFFGLVGSIMIMLGANYDISDYNEEDLSKYNMVENLSADLNDVHQQVDQVTVDKTVFDYLGDIWSKVLAPFKFVYRSFAILIMFGAYVATDLHLLGIFGEFFTAVILVLVIIGIVLIKYYMNRRK